MLASIVGIPGALCSMPKQLLSAESGGSCLTRFLCDWGQASSPFHHNGRGTHETQLAILADAERPCRMRSDAKMVFELQTTKQGSHAERPNCLSTLDADTVRMTLSCYLLVTDSTSWRTNLIKDAQPSCHKARQGSNSCSDFNAPAVKVTLCCCRMTASTGIFRASS